MKARRLISARLIAAVAVGTLAVSAGVAGATSAPPDSEPAAGASSAAPATTATTDAPTTTEATTTTEAPTTTAAPAVTYPLTGVVAPADYTPRPALIVKIDNVNAQPQAGLNEADIVFEEIVEGATRFAAVFNSTDSDPVGPIRSGRVQDVALFSSYNDPIFAFSGGNDTVVGALQATGWTLLTQGNGMFRDGSRSAPHNLFGNTSEFFALAGESGEAVPQFEYGTPAGSPVSSMNVDMAGRNVEWTWDAAQGLFLRSVNGDTHDTTTGQFSTNNVIVLVVPYGNSSDGNPEAQTTGTGPAVVYANGLKTEGTWTREDASQPFTLTDGSGNPIVLTPGRTVVELAETGASIGDTPA
ncbi:DUF3048 domain-containing protein [Desertimonas flava]|uniref:DUF3048 domain-containing protein n=1 Tax=Desertimonas flava TaxID=2064846 RepID=UPI0013C4B645|nr:DUF3048 domain-containing protein [Desertimonas flava]